MKLGNLSPSLNMHVSFMSEPLRGVELIKANKGNSKVSITPEYIFQF